MTSLALQWWQHLAAGAVQSLRTLSDPDIQIADPQAGVLFGIDAAATYTYLTAHDWQQRGAKWTLVYDLETAERSVCEVTLRLQQRRLEHVELPVAVVAEHAGARITSVRIYHSLWPLLGQHQVRAPLLAPQADLALPDAVVRYQRALAQGDVSAILATFAPTGVAREPSGGAFTYSDPLALRQFYSQLFANGGGIPLEHCSVTDDGVACAVEYNVVRWGRARLKPQAGVAIYQRNAQGLLVAARIYDDVDPPVPAAAAAA